MNKFFVRDTQVVRCLGILALLLVSIRPLPGQSTFFNGGGGGNLPDATTGQDAGNPDAGIFTSDIVVTNDGTVGSFDGITMGVLTHSAIANLVFLITHVDTGTSAIFMERVFKLDPSTGFGNPANMDQFFTFVNAPSSTLTSSDSIWLAAYQALIVNGGTGTIGGGTFAATHNDFTGDQTTSYAPTDLDIFAGEVMAGTWRLTVRDEDSGNTGHLNGWGFTATVNPVPEPPTNLLVLFGVLVMTASVYRWRGHRL